MSEWSMTPLAFYRDLLGKGVPEEMAYSIALDFEADREAKAQAEKAELLDRLQATPTAGRSARSARNQRYYDGQKQRLKASETSEIKTLKTVSDVSDAFQTVSDAAEPSRTGAQVVNPSLPHLRSEEVVGGGVVGREGVRQADDWPEGRASDHADQLVRTVASPWLDPSKSPDLVTTRGRIAAWKRDGASWEHDVLPVVTGLCANRRSRISSWKFFDAAISRSIAENRAALAIPEAGEVVPFRNTGPPRQSREERNRDGWDYAIARIAADE